VFTHLLFTKKEISNLQVTLKNPLELSCEKVTQSPRTINTHQIKTAIENISFSNGEKNIVDELSLKALEHVLKDFFLYMHQTGLYNRQFNLWRTLGNIKQAIVFKLFKGFTKKRELPVYMADFFIDIKTPCIKILIHDEDDVSYDNFNAFLKLLLSKTGSNRLKGVFYFLRKLDKDFLNRLTILTRAFDSISKYESLIYGTSDVRLNVITFERINSDLVFKHTYPELKQEVVIS